MLPTTMSILVEEVFEDLAVLCQDDLNAISVSFLFLVI